MTEVSSTGGAVSPESPYGRTSMPTPPRPPAVDDLGPATTSMPPLTSDNGVDSAATENGAGVPPAVDDTTIGYIAPPVVPPGLPIDRPLRPTAPPSALRRPPRTKVTVRGPRRAKLVIRRVDPWTVMKFSFLFSVCLLVVWVVAASSLFSLLRTMHVFDNINSVLDSATSGPQSKGVHIDPKAHDVTRWAAIIGAVNALIFTALATLGAFLYNLISFLVGGIEVTLGERD